KGFAIGFGQLRSGNGFAIGPQFSLSDLMSGRLSVRVGARGSMRKSYIGSVDVSLRDLASGHVFVDFRAEHRNLSEMAYYGPGPDSDKSGRSDYRLEDTTVELRPGFSPFRHVRAGAAAAYMKVNVGPGHSTQYISSELKYSPVEAPGIDKQTDFWRGGGFLE